VQRVEEQVVVAKLED